MDRPRVSITGLASVLSAGSATPVAPCMVALARDLLTGPSHPAREDFARVCMPGPGAALTGAILGRLNVHCQAMVDVGADACGLQLLELLQTAIPHLRPLVKRREGERTAHCQLDSSLEADWTSNDTVVDLPELPPLDELRGALGIWSGAEHCERLRSDAEFVLPTRLEQYEDTGLTRVVAVSAPGPTLVAQKAEHAWLRACAPRMEILCGQADHLFRFVDPKTASSLDAGGQLRQLRDWLNGSLLHEMAGFLLELGVGAVLIGLREQGVYLRTHHDGNRVAFARRFAADGNVAAYLAEWIDREMLVPLFLADTQNAFSRTDACAASLAAGLLAAQTPGDLLLSAAAIVTLAGEERNPVDGVPSWEVAQARVEGGWSQARCQIDLSGWGGDDSYDW
ncbi:MAG: hypothetical protein KIT83_02555 [Bryobacterales bacterium]|nr:hypothetical protein [Bryobacterales bacterium]